MKMKMKCALLATLLFFLSGSVVADTVAVVKARDITVSVTDEPCKLTSLVTNLPMRATWREGKNELIEGCYSIFAEGQMVGLMFEDKTMAVIPVKDFQSVGKI